MIYICIGLPFANDAQYMHGFATFQTSPVLEEVSAGILLLR